MIVFQMRCTQRGAYWRAHPDQWLSPSGPVTGMTLGCEGVWTTAAEALALLEADPDGDASLVLLQQLIAATLNDQQGAENALARSVMEEAREFLCAFPQGSRLKGAEKKKAKELTRMLEAFNEGRLGTPSCQESASGSGLSGLPGGSGDAGSGDTGGIGSGDTGGDPSESGSGGSGVPELDSDHDGLPDVLDPCPNDPANLCQAPAAP